MPNCAKLCQTVHFRYSPSNLSASSAQVKEERGPCALNQTNDELLASNATTVTNQTKDTSPCEVASSATQGSGITKLSNTSISDLISESTNQNLLYPVVESLVTFSSKCQEVHKITKIASFMEKSTKTATSSAATLTQTITINEKRCIALTLGIILFHR